MSLGSKYALGCHSRIVQRSPLATPSCSGGSTCSRLQISDNSFPAHLRSCSDCIASSLQSTVCATSGCTSCGITELRSIRLRSCNKVAIDCPRLTPGRLQSSCTSSVICFSQGLQREGVSRWRRFRRPSFDASGKYDGAEIGPSQEPSETERRQESGGGNFAESPSARFSKVRAALRPVGFCP